MGCSFVVFWSIDANEVSKCALLMMHNGIYDTTNSLKIIISVRGGTYFFCSVYLVVCSNVSWLTILDWVYGPYIVLTAHNWQKWKSIFLTCHCHKKQKQKQKQKTNKQTNKRTKTKTKNKPKKKLLKYRFLSKMHFKKEQKPVALFLKTIGSNTSFTPLENNFRFIYGVVWMQDNNASSFDPVTFQETLLFFGQHRGPNGWH